MKNFKVISMFESFKELFLSTANTAVNRAKNPVLGAFVMSWCAFNWKSILYLFFSKSNIIDKISYISDNSTWKTVMFYPCLSVIAICCLGNDSNLLIVFYVQIMPDDLVMQLHRF
ncbi:hypothetical protein WKU_04561 [Escherichia coli KTE177]|nr:hypothetical protein A17U_01545 [Escherichia coli KTE228]ELJ37182.1 hypothetical protein WKU_04561 [Escherichia coli KTE177]